MATELDLPPSAQPTPRRVAPAITELVAHAQAAGAMRADIGPADVSMLFSGVAHTTALAGDLAADAARALRAHHPRRSAPTNATELPGTPLDFAQLDRMKQRRAR